MDLVPGEWSVSGYLERSKEPEASTARYIIRKVSECAMNTFETVIDQMPEARVEYHLWHYGMCAVWDHPVLGTVCTPVSVVGYDINGIPNRFKPVIKNTDVPEIPELTEEDAVVFYDTSDPYVYRKQCLEWVDDYADVTETIRQQVFNQKTPMMAVAGTKGMAQRLKRSIVDIARNMRVIFVDADGLKDKLQPLDFNAPYNVQDLHGYRKTLEHEMLEFCGIDHSAGFQKKERMIVDEQEANDEMLNYVLAGCLRARQAAIDRLAMFGMTGHTEVTGIQRPIEAAEEGEDGEDLEDA